MSLGEFSCWINECHLENFHPGFQFTYNVLYFVYVSAWSLYILLVSTNIHRLYIISTGILCGHSNLQFYMVAVSMILC